jgi:hypothetical protein
VAIRPHIRIRIAVTPAFELREESVLAPAAQLIGIREKAQGDQLRVHRNSALARRGFELFLAHVIDIENPRAVDRLKVLDVQLTEFLKARAGVEAKER